ncbi:MAG TPA: glycerophosphoryl diester phosphodiesterase membrane domain-containing protein [Allosphingosinicella sp.]|jgi:membrane-anchored glycerophosphoryl diester phosphodiesterase (GDPDase)
MNLSITKAWDEAAAFVKQEAGILFPIVFALTVLPSLIAQTLSQRLAGDTGVAHGSTADPGPLLAGALAVLLMLVAVIFLSSWGNLVVNLLAMRRETLVRNAFGRALRRVLPLLGATLLCAIAAIAIVLPFAAAVGLGAGTPRPGPAALLLLIVIPAAFFFGVRLMLMSPVAAAERSGPIGIIRRSWQLTSGHFWQLLGFLLLMILVILVLLLAVRSVGGILITMTAGEPKPDSLGFFLMQLVSGILQAVWATYFITAVARIYEQLAGDVGSVAGIFE